MSQFKKFSQKIHTRYNELAKQELFVVDMDKDALWAYYLAAFPEGTNPIFRERTEHDCSCCWNFIKNLGNVVAVIDGKLQTIWDVQELDYPYDVVAAALHEAVVNRPIVSLFRTKERSYGKETNYEQLNDGSVLTWNHFHGQVTSRHHSTVPAQLIGNYNTSAELFKRGLTELKPRAFTDVLDLIQNNSLYRGQEFLQVLQEFHGQQQMYQTLTTEQARNLFVWQSAHKGYARFKNTVIGTLIQDLSEGMELEAAVKSFEAKVAPANYKRPTALITPRMIEDAVKTINDLGLESALERRHARISDVSVNNVLWVDNDVRSKMKGGLESLLLSAVPTQKPATDKAEEIRMEDFMASILPKAKGMEMFFKSAHQARLVSLTAPVHAEVEPIFKWSNNFAWSYNGNMTDSVMRQAVQARGGRVDGVFRFTHSWNHERPNTSLMDLHVFMPGSSKACTEESNDIYGNAERVGWNHRNHRASGGVQDVDYVAAAPHGYIPVENITFPALARMPEGKYTCMIHNWQFRAGTVSGFKAEIEFGGQIFEYDHPKALSNKQWVKVAEVTLKKGQFTIEHFLSPTCSSKHAWGIQTEQFVKVNTVMLSPNHWDDQAVGNKHWLFMLEGCKNDTPARGIYNEYLRNDLDKHRKVFEVLGNKTQCPVVDDQLSGLGFSSTQPAEVLIKVTTEKATRLYNVLI